MKYRIIQHEGKFIVTIKYWWFWLPLCVNGKYPEQMVRYSSVEEAEEAAKAYCDRTRQNDRIVKECEY